MIFNLEHETPPVYTEESRDFQILLRLYNALFTSSKYLTDSMTTINDVKHIRTDMLPLLQRKLGFESNYNFNNEVLRGILSGFCSIIRNKGSLLAIEQSLAAFLSVLKIKTTIVVKFAEDGSVITEGSMSDHNIIIGINEAIDNFYILDELFRYILPAGFSYSFYFYRDLSKETYLLNHSTGHVLIISSNINDSIRYKNQYNDASYEYPDEIDNRLINASNLLRIWNLSDDLILTETEPEDFATGDYFKFIGDQIVRKSVGETWAANTYYYFLSECSSN